MATPLLVGERLMVSAAGLASTTTFMGGNQTGVPGGGPRGWCWSEVAGSRGGGFCELSLAAFLPLPLDLRVPTGP